MEIKVKNLYVRISPRKVRPVIATLRGKNAEEVRNSLAFLNKKAARYAFDLVKAGIAAAKENYIDADKILIKHFYCNEGPRLKRMIPWSKGQSRRITKRMSHLTLVLESAEKVKPADKKEKSDNQELAKKDKE